MSTTTTGFIGPTRFGPIDIVPDVITSLGEFELAYGDRKQLQYVSSAATTVSHNFLWHAVRAFFEEGGKRLYCMRTFKPFVLAADKTIDADKSKAAAYSYPAATIEKNGPKTTAGGLTVYEDGHARALLGASATPVMLAVCVSSLRSIWVKTFSVAKRELQQQQLIEQALQACLTMKLSGLIR